MVKRLVVASALGALVSGAAAQTAGPWGQRARVDGFAQPYHLRGTISASRDPVVRFKALAAPGPLVVAVSGPPVAAFGLVARPAVLVVAFHRCVRTFSLSVVLSCPMIPRLIGHTFVGPTSTTSSVRGVTTTSSAVESGGTLIPGNSYIRGVEAPFFHLYLQSEAGGTTPGDAILASYMTAAQFQVTGGQLIMNPTGSSKLYGQVARPASGDVKLKVTWATTQSTFGTFSWSGDTLLWSDPSVTRSQNNAWLGCTDSGGKVDLYVNLGPYGYNTPSGCSDQTIHAYTGPSAVP
ncbi:hypothetical protein FRC17_001222 [Serendipita sp. 399]|nr:hypothetical protein FRC17_001222 [Serendipita sp. 399]